MTIKWISCENLLGMTTRTFPISQKVRTISPMHAYVRVQNLTTKSHFCKSIFQHVRTLIYFTSNSFDSQCFGNSLMSFRAGLRVESEAW